MGLIRKVIRLVGFATAPQISTASNTVDWIAEFIKFRGNVRDLCRNIGSELEENAPLWETIRNLRKYASEGKQKMSPLFKQIDSLKARLERKKRIIAALQIRCTIENLVNEIPDKGKYNDAPRFKWRKLWGDILENVNTNDQNPFYALLKDARGYRAEDIKRAGLELYSAMSAEIHGFEGLEVNYEHFDRSTRKYCSATTPRSESRRELEGGNKEVSLQSGRRWIVLQKSFTKGPARAIERMDRVYRFLRGVFE